MTPQERTALATALVLLAAGAGARLLRTPPPPPAWPPGAADTAVARLGERAESALVRQQRAAVPLAADERIDVNLADAVELQRLPGIGPRLAERIVEHRRVHGPFRTLADLDAVPGIGPAMLARLAPRVGLPAAPSTPATPAAAAAARSSARPAVPAVATPLDLNRATAVELTALPGVGPVTAGRIVQWREQHGRFASVAELERVPGIGARTVERLAPYVRVGP